jgi:lipopolysaccharide transport system permease protein
MTTSLVQNMDLVSKIYFPRETLPISAMFARLMDFGIAILLLVFLMVYYRVAIDLVSLFYIPVILLVQITLIVGLGLLLSAMNVFFRDVQSLLTLVIQLWFYASPIIYPVELVPARLKVFYNLNPMVGILEAYRAVLLHQSFPSPALIIAALEALVIFFLGYLFFKKVERVFADIV